MIKKKLKKKELKITLGELTNLQTKTANCKNCLNGNKTHALKNQ